MSRAATLRTVGDQITTLLTGFALTTAARELVSRFVEAEQQPALRSSWRSWSSGARISMTGSSVSVRGTPTESCSRRPASGDDARVKRGVYHGDGAQPR
jgi:hypothetical protein